MSAESTQSQTVAPAGQEGTATTTQTPSGGEQKKQETTAKVETKSEGSALFDDDATAGGDEKTKEGEQGAQGDKADAKEQAGELKLTWPEGLKVDEAAKKEFEGFAAKAKLSSEQASAILAYEQERVAKYDQELKKLEAQREADWLKQIKDHKEFGGKNFEQAKIWAKAALKQFGGDEAAAALKAAHLGNHPWIFSILASVGRAMKEDSTKGTTSTANGGVVKGTGKERLAKAYPTMHDTNGNPLPL